MDEQKYEDIGYIRFCGGDVPSGVIDAASAGSALLGLDEAVRFFNERQAPDLSRIEYDIPVRTQAGSWEAVIVAGAVASGGALALGYAKKAGEKLAENDFKDIGLKDVLRKSLNAIQTLVRIVKHTRQARGWGAGRVSNSGDLAMVAIANQKGEEIEIPAEYYLWFKQLPPRFLVKITSVVRTDRVLLIGVSFPNTHQEVEVGEVDKPLFDDTAEEEYEEVLFPELAHGAEVRLEGRLIRGNETSNSVGLEYQGRILNCVPAHGSVRQYKPALFLRCAVEGRITRHAKHRFVPDRRPTIILSNVTPLERDTQFGLFGG